MQVIQRNRLFRQAKRHRHFLFVLAAISGVISAPAAFASNITVASPASGATTSSTVWIRAHNIGCNGLSPTAFGYSIDSSGATTFGVSPYDIDVAHQSFGAGKHVIHFKSWTTAGVCPVVDSAINVAGGPSTPVAAVSSNTSGLITVSASIPSNAIASADLDTDRNWAYEHDAGTPGSSRGSTAFPATTPVYDNAREFYMTYTSRGGERWHISFANDDSATHFIFDTYVYVVNPSQLANLELDLNQVLSNGQTVIYGTQCAVYSQSWEWAYISGGHPHWHASNVPCNPMTWAPNTWHHIQMGFHRSGGYVTHDWVSFDGKQSNFSGASASSAQALGWGKGTLLMNMQMDGYSGGSGSIKAYFHKTTYYRW
jgi:hypothetical protein